MTPVRVLAVALFLLATGIAGAQPARLAPNDPSLARPSGRVSGTPDNDVPMGPREAKAPMIELLTFGVGGRIFEKYGHAAICLHYNDARNQPICFNYGVTNFNEGSKMIWSFLRSTQKFWAEPTARGEFWQGDAAGKPKGMIGFYSWEDRDIWSQRLVLLTDAQRRTIETRIWDGLREENRYYYYDHFFDNCTTRLRDMLDEVTGGALRTGTSDPYPLTFREMGRRGLAEFPPLLALTDFVIGRQAEDTPTLWEAMFHPDVLRQVVELRLGVAPELIYKRRGPAFPVDGPSGRLPMLIIALCFALPLLLARGVSRQVRQAVKRLGLDDWVVPLVAAMTLAIGAACLWFGWTAQTALVWGFGGLLVLGVIAMSERAALIFATTYLGFWGALIYTLVIISSIVGVRWNEAVLVVIPFDVVLPFLGEARRRRYAQIRVALLMVVSALCALGVLVQPLWIPILCAFLPLAILAFDLPSVLFGPRAQPSPPAPLPVRPEPAPLDPRAS